MKPIVLGTVLGLGLVWLAAWAIIYLPADPGCTPDQFEWEGECFESVNELH